MLHNAVNKNMVLDVSNLDEDGKGSRSMDLPKTANSKKKGVEGFPVISNNFETYKLAMDILGPEYEAYTNDYRTLYVTPALTAATTVTFPFPLAEVTAVAVTGVKSPSPRDKLVKALTEAISAGRVIDVSELKENGTGIRAGDFPKTTLGTKKWVGDFPVLSNNYATYQYAMGLLGPDYDTYADNYLAMYGEAKRVRTPGVAKAPEVAKPPRSPKRFGPLVLFPPRTVVPEVQPRVIPVPQVQAQVPARIPVVHQKALVIPRPQPRPVTPPQPRPVTPPQSPFILPSPTIFSPVEKLPREKKPWTKRQTPPQTPPQSPPKSRISPDKSPAKPIPQAPAFAKPSPPPVEIPTPTPSVIQRQSPQTYRTPRGTTTTSPQKFVSEATPQKQEFAVVSPTKTRYVTQKTTSPQFVQEQ